MKAQHFLGHGDHNQLLELLRQAGLVAHVGAEDRGLLRDGFKADVVVFDAKTVMAPAKQFPIGIDYVIVNGQVVIDGGRHTGLLAGRAPRRGRTST